MKFEALFENPVYFVEDTTVISREKYSREEAAALISKAVDYEVDPKSLREERVRFRPLTRDERNLFDDELGPLAWILGEEGKGSKAVWVYER